MNLLAPILCLCTAATLLAQTAPPAQQPASAVPTLRARANLVVVDVVVTDKNRNPIKNLKREDFTLLEDKTPQTIGSFEEHAPLAPGEAAKIPALPKLPPGIFTNVTPAPVNSAVNVLLLDALNTPLADQDYLHKQLIAYLKSVPPGTSIAIFGLKQKLVMLQGFTANPGVLLQVVQKSFGQNSPLLADSIGGGSANESLSDLTSALGLQVPAGLTFFEDQVSTSQLEERSRLTLDAINNLGRYLAGIRGRKNLIWFAGSFPIDLTPTISTGNFSNGSLDLPSGQAEYRDTINLLARSQVAVYPINASGLQASPAFNAAGGASLAPITPLNDSTAMDSIAANHQAAARIATDTGGRAFYNVNDLTKAVDEAVSEGSSYYTLTYTPANSESKGDFRKIEIKLNAPDVKGAQLAYRRGYYAAKPNSDLSALNSSSPDAPASAGDIGVLPRAMIHGVPGPTEILFKTRVLPFQGFDDKPAPNNLYTPSALAAAKGSFRRFAVDFDTEAHNYVFTPTADGKFNVKAEFAAIVYNADGKRIDTVSTTLVADITAAQRASFLTRGLPFRLQVSVPEHGDYFLRLGVHDFNSDHVGSVELPIAAVAGLPPIPDPAAPASPAAPTK
jgi:VWFA-related protein